MSLFSVARRHTRLALGLIAVALGVTGLEVISARSAEIAPDRLVAAAPGVAVETSSAPAPSPQHSRLAKPSVASAPTETTPTSNNAMPITGKGMWIWLFDTVEGGNATRIAQRAKQMGLSHIYVRSSSSNSGLKFLGDIDEIVPAAHRLGINVIAWDFPTLKNAYADVRRIQRVLDHKTPGGDRVDGIAVDLETAGEGVQLTRAGATWFSRTLARTRPERFRVLVPPRPSAPMRRAYPYGIIGYYNAVAPMVYWGVRNPLQLVRETIRYLRRFGRPIAPIGQSYDMAIDGGRGNPSGYVIARFAQEARRLGAVGVSYWSWQHANREQLRAIAGIDFPLH